MSVWSWVLDNFFEELEEVACKEFTQEWSMHQTKSGECDGDTHIDVWVWSMDIVGETQGRSTGYADEGVKMDRGSVEIG